MTQTGGSARRVTRAVLLASMVAACLAAATPSSSPTAVHRGAPPAPMLTSASSQDPGRPAVTLLYQNFPNPFPTADSRTTCIWFDLDRVSSVTLTVHDVRGNLVRQLLPATAVPQPLSPGRYGRASPTSGTGCAAITTWDGRADNGEVVPRGVYLIRLRAAGTESVKKALFQGP